MEAGRKEVLRSALIGGGGGASLPAEEADEAVEGTSASVELVGWRRRPPMAQEAARGRDEGYDKQSQVIQFSAFTRQCCDTRW